MKSSETIIFLGVEITVEFGYEEGQKEIIRADPNDCQEGFGPTFEIHAIKVGKVDVTGLFEDEAFPKIEDALLDALIERVPDYEPY